MAYRNDITVDWSQSPRIIQVASPSTDVTMQDLYDTLRILEVGQIDEPFIINGAGKEPLGGGVLVGLTLTLQNALLEFEARPGPSYTLCTVGGGNLVAIDANGDPVASPINPTAFVSIVQANSSSATLQELKAIEFSSFNGGVTIDVGNTTGRATGGTTFPAGTEQQPCDNLLDLSIIAEDRGLNKIYVKGDLTLDNSHAWIGHEFIGESQLKTTMTIPSDSQVVNCEFYDATINGTLDGNSHIERCVVDSIDFVDGYVYHCSIGPGVITLGTITIANIFSTFSTVPGTSTPTIDMNGTGRLALRDYNGGVLLTNYNGNDSHSIDLASGQIKLDATITSGTFVVRGIGKLIDTSGNPILSGTWNGGVTIINELLNAVNLDTTTWSTTEKEQIREALGVDGTKTSSQNGTLQFIKSILEGDIIPTPTEFKILDKLSKAVLVSKQATTDSETGLTKLEE